LAFLTVIVVCLCVRVCDWCVRVLPGFTVCVQLYRSLRSLSNVRRHRRIEALGSAIKQVALSRAD